MLYNVVLTFKSVNEILSVTIGPFKQKLMTFSFSWFCLFFNNNNN